MPTLNLKRNLFAALLAVVPATAAAQQGTVITYATDPVPIYQYPYGSRPNTATVAYNPTATQMTPNMYSGVAPQPYGGGNAHMAGQAYAQQPMTPQPYAGGYAHMQQPAGVPTTFAAVPQATPQEMPQSWTTSIADGEIMGCEECCGECEWTKFCNFGFKGLRREQLGSTILALVDDSGVDDGLPPSVNAPVAARFDILEPGLAGGIQGSYGVYNQKDLFEISAFYMFDQIDVATVTDPGRLFTFFVNPPFPLTFDIWDNADSITLDLLTNMANLEFNWRRWYGKGALGYQTLVGFRYFDLQERLDIITDDDGIEFEPDPTRVAKYRVRTHNHMCGPQLGVGSHIQLSKWLGISGEARGAWFGNYAAVDVVQTDGNGFTARVGEKQSLRFGHLYEAGLSLDFCCDNCQLRLGYNAMWVLGVAEAVDQVSFDLEDADGRDDYGGSIFYHGPSVTLEFTY